MNLGKLGQALTAREIFDLIQDELAQVESKLTAESVAPVDAVTAIGQYLQSSGGKRLRPTLLLISSKLADPDGADGNTCAIQLGAVVELPSKLRMRREPFRVGMQSRLDPVPLEQPARMPRVLAQHDVCGAQLREHAQRDVLEIPDRRRADDEGH